MTTLKRSPQTKARRHQWEPGYEYDVSEDGSGERNRTSRDRQRRPGPAAAEPGLPVRVVVVGGACRRAGHRHPLRGDRRRIDLRVHRLQGPGQLQVRRPGQLRQDLQRRRVDEGADQHPDHRLRLPHRHQRDRAGLRPRPQPDPAIPALPAGDPVRPGGAQPACGVLHLEVHLPAEGSAERVPGLDRAWSPGSRPGWAIPRWC